MSYLTDGKIGVSLTAVTTGTTTDGEDAQFTLGLTAQGNEGSEWMYVQAGGAITQYACVLIDEDGQMQEITTTLATEADTSAGDRVGFAQVAFADNEFGWVALKGQSLQCLLSASCADHVRLYTTATAGTLDDVSVGVLITGVASAETITATTNAEIIATNPVSRLVAALAG